LATLLSSTLQSSDGAVSLNLSTGAITVNLSGVSGVSIRAAQSPLEAAPGEPVHVLAWGLLEPITDETQARWSFVGADEHEHELVEVLERLTPAGARVRLSLSPTTHLLRRVQVIGDDGHVEREYSYHDYRDADGVRLPYWMSYTGKEAGERIVEVVSEYTLTRER
ncbi:MAG: hypothetical protein IH936_09735, partial [Acidobacteria bacterium]|nr:hypothetical protein [Acidobacteriota bacterium]